MNADVILLPTLCVIHGILNNFILHWYNPLLIGPVKGYNSFILGRVPPHLQERSPMEKNALKAHFFLFETKLE